MSNMTLAEELTWRGFVNQTTYKDITYLDDNKIVFYWGVDPSANSMTIGNLAAAMMARVFIKHGHQAVLLVGGATGMIGDPDGKAQERDLLTLEQIAANKKAISAQYNQVFGEMQFKVVDNYDWFKDIGYLEFLRAVGKHVPMRAMLGREFVQSRLGEDGAGISYAEFSYSLIQGYDFLHLFKEHGVTLQLCGADQWGNSIAGVDLIRRIAGGEAHVWSSPLVINRATGKKFGKTEDGAIWLDEAQTSVFKFYQFWINADDEGVEEYIKIYTDLDKETVDDIMQAHNEARSNRLAQKHLAYEATKLVHGEERAESVRRISEVLFGEEEYSDLTSGDFSELKNELKTVSSSVGAELAQVLVDTGLASSKGEARRFLESNAIYINGSQIPLEKREIDTHDVLNGYVVLRRGKNATALLEIK
ncbi:tyrosine--tRNA ligase [Candidatus Saccharibacteria bacterium]|nr:tyrosine--tRNA ligase [Candidatus Saccharibacteria bacterium]